MNDTSGILLRIDPIFRQVLGEDVIVTLELDATTVESWDSLNHITLIVEIENLFNIEFSSSELGSILKVGDLVDLVISKLNS